MSDTQLMLGAIVSLVTILLALGGMRFGRKGRFDDALHDDRRMQVEEMRVELTRYREEQREYERLARVREDELRQRVSDLESSLAQALARANALRWQLEGLGAVPVV